MTFSSIMFFFVYIHFNAQIYDIKYPYQMFYTQSNGFKYFKQLYTFKRQITFLCVILLDLTFLGIPVYYYFQYIPLKLIYFTFGFFNGISTLYGVFYSILIQSQTFDYNHRPLFFQRSIARIPWQAIHCMKSVI